MKDIELGVQDVKELMAAMDKNRIAHLKIEQGSFRLELEGHKAAQVVAAPTASAVPAGSAAILAQDPADDSKIIRSPIVGTFYSAPSPGKEPFVTEGSAVKKGEVLFIIESMKLMNEVLAEQDGIVAQILVENARGVEYGQPILLME